jgi:hypothetical protein
MKHLWSRSFSLGMALLLIVILVSGSVFAQTINVTMRLNTATNRDTLMTHHVVQIRGEASGTVNPAITWGNDTGITLTNVGGDYWETTFQMTPGSTLKFKFWTGFDGSTGTFFWGGWEGPIKPANPVDSGGNRWFVAGSNDTTLALQFYNGADTEKDQYWQPYETKADTFAVYLRVNLAALMETDEFVPETDGPVVVRGSKPMDPTDSWNTLFPLSREAGSALNGSFYSGVAYIAKSAVAGGEWQNYKFVYSKNGSDVWESVANRYFQYKAPRDTTINWVYFNNQRPTGGNIVEATLTWQMKTDALEKLGLFDRSIGDKIVIDGAKAWDVANAVEMNYVPLLGAWVGQEPFKKAPGAVLEYKAVLLWDASRADVSSPNYIPGLDLPELQYWEEPSVTGTGNRNYTFTSATEQMIPGDLGLDCQFFCGLPVEGVIETPITITFNVDMNPAADVGTNPSNPLFRPGIDTVWVHFYGCLLPLTQGDGLYTNTPLLLQDPDGDLVYTGSMALQPPVPFDCGYRIDYSSETGAIIQNGGGFTKGRSYYQYVHPVKILSDGTITWPAEFSFPTVYWMDSDLTVEDPPDLWTPMGVSPDNGSMITTYALSQNYPNPFNPSTTIYYQVPEKSDVRISVYNLMGQLVTTLVDEQKMQGKYTIRWDGSTMAGHVAPSGVYFVQMLAGSFEQVRKITFIR